MMSIDWTKMQAVVLGLFGGAGATLLWEAFLKPKRDRVYIATALAAEVELNMQAAEKMLLVMERKHPTYVPVDFRFVAVLFPALAENVGALPAELLPELTLFYAGILIANEQTAEARALADERRRAEASAKHESPMLEILDKEWTGTRRIVHDNLQLAVRRGNRLLPQLRAASLSAWSPRRLLHRWAHRREPVRDDLVDIENDRIAGSPEYMTLRALRAGRESTARETIGLIDQMRGTAVRAVSPTGPSGRNAGFLARFRVARVSACASIRRCSPSSAGSGDCSAAKRMLSSRVVHRDVPRSRWRWP